MKARRQAEILAIIQEYDIETQDQLLEKLREKGMKSTHNWLSKILDACSSRACISNSALDCFKK